MYSKRVRFYLSPVTMLICDHQLTPVGIPDLPDLSWASTNDHRSLIQHVRKLSTRCAPTRLQRCPDRLSRTCTTA